MNNVHAYIQGASLLKHRLLQEVVLDIYVCTMYIHTRCWSSQKYSAPGGSPRYIHMYNVHTYIQGAGLLRHHLLQEIVLDIHICTMYIHMYIQGASLLRHLLLREVVLDRKIYRWICHKKKTYACFNINTWPQMSLNPSLIIADDHVSFKQTKQNDKVMINVCLIT